MKPQRFEIGQAVTPNEKLKNMICETGQRDKCPLKFGEIYHILRYGHQSYSGQWYVAVKEFGPEIGFQEKVFDPVITDDSLLEELYQIELEITA